MSTLPPSLRSRFTTEYDGFPAVIFTNSVEYHNFTAQLASLKVSYLTKIKKAKPRGRGRELVVLLVEE